MNSEQAFETGLEELEFLAKELGLSLWNKVIFIENLELEPDHEDVIRINSTWSVPEYRARFKDEIGSTYSWANFNILGVLNNILIINVELPSNGHNFNGSISINISGPQNWHRDRAYRLNGIVCV